MTNSKRFTGKLSGLIFIIATTAFLACSSAVPENCGDGVTYNSQTQFCYDGAAVDKCAGEVYDLSYQTCDNRIVKDKCTNSNKYFQPETEFCADTSVYQKCGGAEYNPASQTCDDNTVKTQCGDGKLAASCHTLTASAIPEEGGTVTRNPSATSYAFGESVGVIATPSSNDYTFVGWSGALQSVNPTGAVVMNGDKSLVAMFNPVGDPGANTYTLMTGVDPTNGGIVFVNNAPSTGTSTHNREVQVTVRAEAAPGFTFTGWTGTSPSQNAETTLIMLSNHTMIANFKQEAYTLTVNANPAEGGTAARAPEKTSYTAGEQVTITATTKSGYIFSNWTGGTVADANSAITTVTMNSDMTLTANFRQEGSSAGPYTLTVNANPTTGGTVGPTSGQSHNANTPITITASPATGYTFVNWTVTGGGTIAIANSATTTVMLTDNATVTANFLQQGGGGEEKGTFAYEGQTYRWVKIGIQTWMAENLNYETVDSWCYDNADSNCVKYGRLYTWDAAMNACQGLGNDWRLPTRDDWERLFTAVGGINVAGRKLKANSPDWDGIDSLGFSALPGGCLVGDFSGIGSYGRWWSESYDFGTAGTMVMRSDILYVTATDARKEYGFSVRCVR